MSRRIEACHSQKSNVHFSTLVEFLLLFDISTSTTSRCPASSLVELYVCDGTALWPVVNVWRGTLVRAVTSRVEVAAWSVNSCRIALMRQDFASPGRTDENELDVLRGSECVGRGEGCLEYRVIVVSLVVISGQVLCIDETVAEQEMNIDERPLVWGCPCLRPS